MSLCSRLALFSSSSRTTSRCPSLAAEISAVQQSCTKQPVRAEYPLRSQRTNTSVWRVGGWVGGRVVFEARCGGYGSEPIAPTSWSYQILMDAREAATSVRGKAKAKQKKGDLCSSHTLSLAPSLRSSACVGVCCAVLRA